MTAWPGIRQVDVGLDFGSDGRVHYGRISLVDCGRYLFETDRDFLSRGINPAPYTMARSIKEQEGSAAFAGLHPVFSDSEPDGWTKHLVERRAATSGFNLRDLTKLDRLALVGDAGIGALSYSPQAGADVPLKQLGPDDIADLISGVNDATPAQIELAEIPKSHASCTRCGWRCAPGTRSPARRASLPKE